MVIKMIYLDYSATTKVDIDVLHKFNEAATNNFANVNSHYKIAEETSKMIKQASKTIANFFNVLPEEIIYTSGASESNNFAIKGVIDNYPGKQIITTELEHSSIITPLGYLQKKGYKISFVNLLENGEVDLDHLQELLKTNTCLVTIGYVSSELGIIQPINEIGKIVKNYPKTVFHSDITQAVGKIDIDLTNVDLASFSGHKFYCFKGIGCLIKKSNVNLSPLIHGGRSLTNYRSGTPQNELIISLAYALNKMSNLNIDHIQKLRHMIKNHLAKYEDIIFNSNDISVPQIINLSVLNKPSEVTQKYFNEYEIYFSTKTACSLEGTYSKAVFILTKSLPRAETSIRISLSKYTTEDEIIKLLNVFDKYMGE